MPVPNMSAQGMQQTLQMMRENPGMMEQMRSTFACMSPEQMQAAVSCSPSAVLLLQPCIPCRLVQK